MREALGLAVAGQSATAAISWSWNTPSAAHRAATRSSAPRRGRVDDPAAYWQLERRMCDTKKRPVPLSVTSVISSAVAVKRYTQGTATREGERAVDRLLHLVAARTDAGVVGRLDAPAGGCV